MKVEFAGVTKSFDNTKALSSVWLELEPGAIYAILGANGAGKSTMLHLLAGLLVPNRGLIQMNDQVFRRNRIDLRRKLCFLPDFPVFFPSTTVLQHIAMMLRFYEAERDGIEEETAALLDSFDILELANHPVITLSRGQAYKAALAAVILVRPELWLLDEPMASGMDTSGLRIFKTKAAEAAKAGGTVVYTTQIAEVAEQFSDRLILLHESEVKANGTPAQLREENGGISLEEVLVRLQTNAK